MCLYAISVQRGADEVACHSCRGRRPSSSWNSISYIAANHRRRAGFNTEHGHGTREATISTLVEAVVRFLGGRYVDSADHVYDVDIHDPPDDRIGRWRWFCKAALIGQERADEIWRNLWDESS